MTQSTVVTLTPLPLPVSLANPVAQFQTDITQALADGQGQVTLIPAPDAALVFSDAQAVLAAALPLIEGTDATIASPALDASTYVAASANLVAQPVGTVRQLRIINPNLFALGQRYFQDVTRWLDIAVASGISPPDPQPIGLFLITIPTG